MTNVSSALFSRKLVERLESMKRHRAGNGETDCILCGEVFRFYHRSQKRCLDCGKMTCGKCGVEVSAHGHLGPGAAAAAAAAAAAGQQGDPVRKAK